MNALEPEASGRLVLQADRAADLMTSNPVSIGQDATIKEAVVLLTDKGISAAPVIDQAGRPVGVVSHTDIIAHDREHVEPVDRTQVRDIMTPALFSVTPDTPAAQVVEQLVALNVHQLFVVDRAGVLLGVIGTTDILRRLKP